MYPWNSSALYLSILFQVIEYYTLGWLVLDERPSQLVSLS